MSKKNRFKKQKKAKEYSVKINISDVISSLQLSNDNIEELENNIFYKTTKDCMSEIFSDQNLTLAQKMLMSYIRGSIDNPKVVKEELGLYEQFLDIDKAHKFSYNFFDSENGIKFMRNILGIITMTLEISISDVEAEIAKTTDEEEKKEKMEFLESFRAIQEDHYDTMKNWESDIEKWRVKQK